MFTFRVMWWQKTKRKRSNMKNTFIILFTLITTVIIAQPKISIEQPDHDFGTFNEGVDSAHVFIVKNVGDRPLYIISVSKPCGCTSPTYSEKPIKPNETGTVVVRYYSADHPGHFKKTLQIRTNDPKNSVFTISISGTVIPKL